MTDQRKDKAGDQDVQVTFTEFDQTLVRIDASPFLFGDDAGWGQFPLTKGECGGGSEISGVHDFIIILARRKPDFISMRARSIVPGQPEFSAKDASRRRPRPL
jgi:hypothetical protein